MLIFSIKVKILFNQDLSAATSSSKNRVSVSAGLRVKNFLFDAVPAKIRQRFLL